ncbi:hypothetical protein QHH_43 [Halomonas phage QHHSV-1]|nr:hypothetical protein QHH_43 [Halomonas phage QHHSV-1]
MAMTKRATRRATQRPTRRPSQLPRKGGTPAPSVVLAQPTNLTVTEV